MEVGVKQADKLKEKATEMLVEFIDEVLGLKVTIKNEGRIQLKHKNDIEADKKKFIQKLREVEKKNGKISSLNDSKPIVSLYEMSFLKDMISGKFNKSSEASFKSEAEKKLFVKYSSFSPSDLKKKYAKFQKELNALK